MIRRAHWPALLGVCAAVAGFAVLAPWVRAVGTPIPETVELPEEQVAEAGVPEDLSAAGTFGWIGACLLGLAVLLVVIAMWSLSPKYSPDSAGYLAIAGSIAGVALTLTFVLGPGFQRSAFGSAVELQTDTVSLTWWPWVTLAFFAAACVAAVMIVPSERRSADGDPAA